MALKKTETTEKEIKPKAEKKAEVKKTDKKTDAISADVKAEPKKDATKASSKKRLDVGILHVQSTYNNTKVILTDSQGNSIMWSSAGALGFKGAKKGTPFAAAKVGETLAAKAVDLGLKEVSVVVKGVGSGREAAIRGFISKGVALSTIKDATPVPFNGPQPKKPRRV